jgi:hypothetical protein
MSNEELLRLAEALERPGCPVDLTRLAAEVLRAIAKGGK